MPPGYVYITLITFLIGGVFCAQTRPHRGRDRQLAQHGDGHTIDIDDQAFDGFSGDHGDMDTADDEGSGFDDGEDWEDDEGSTPVIKPSRKSMCERLRDDLNGKKLIGAYIPRCTQVGEFEPMQCHGSTGECWCVNSSGQEVAGTMRRAPHTPNCDEQIKIVQPKRPPAPENRPDPNTEVQVQPHPDPNPDQPSSTDPDIVYERENDKPSKMDPNKDQTNVDISLMPEEDGERDQYEQESMPLETGILEKPGVLAAIIGGAVVGLLCAVLAVMFCVYRMRKKDEGSYALDDNSKRSPSLSYTRANTEYFA